MSSPVLSNDLAYVMLEILAQNCKCDVSYIVQVQDIYDTAWISNFLPDIHFCKEISYHSRKLNFVISDVN